VGSGVHGIGGGEPRVRFYGVASSQLAEALELFPTHEEADAVVRAWGH
jgi:hypothetical protein